MCRRYEYLKADYDSEIDRICGELIVGDKSFDDVLKKRNKFRRDISDFRNYMIDIEHEDNIAEIKAMTETWKIGGQKAINESARQKLVDKYEEEINVQLICEEMESLYLPRKAKADRRKRTNHAKSRKANTLRHVS